MRTESFRWGILGAGNIAVKFCDAVNGIADCTVAAVGSKSLSRAETFARENGIERWYGNYEELLKNEKPDAVYIAATSNDHYRLTMMALDYGIPVLCEKAMFQNSGQASVVFARSEKEKIFVMEAMWSRFLPAVRTAAKWLEQGRIGRVTAAEAAIGFLAPYEPSNRYFNPALGGGAALDLTVYTFELLTFFLGHGYLREDVTVYPSETGVDETEHIVLEYPEFPAVMTTSLRAPLEEQLVLCGTEGRIVVPHPHMAEESILFDRSGKCVEAYRDTETVNGFQYEIREAMGCIREGRTESRAVPHRDTMACAELFDRIGEVMEKKKSGGCYDRKGNSETEGN